jgi:hypothetical protein
VPPSLFTVGWVFSTACQQFFSDFPACFRKGKCVVYIIYTTLSNSLVAVLRLFLSFASDSRSGFVFARLARVFDRSHLYFTFQCPTFFRPTAPALSSLHRHRESFAARSVPLAFFAGTNADITLSPLSRQIWKTKNEFIFRARKRLSG